jgi:hypothetical protein
MSQKVGLFVKTMFEKQYHQTNWETSEHFLLLLLANTLFIEKYDFLDNLLAQSNIDLSFTTESMNDLPVSSNFKGNFWRMSALFLLREAQQ